MMSSIELPLFPSCLGAVDWSPDGELAVAAGEQVHILAPKIQGEIGPEVQIKDIWNISRIRVNVFTNAEWAMIYPQNRDDFSIAAEQSTSTVLGLAWSPPGLARFRRSLLVVLTSNLLLSLWEPVGAKAQWQRVGIVNHALHPNPAAPADLTGLDLRRANIRSFQWCPPLRPSAQINDPSPLPDPDTRWGVHLLAVATDANEVVLLRVRRLAGLQTSTQPYYLEKLAVQSVEPVGSHFPQACKGSLLEKALQQKVRITRVSCGPWLDMSISSEHGVYSVTALIAVQYGTQLQFVKSTIVLNESDPNREVIPRYEVLAQLGSNPLASLPGPSKNYSQHSISGPLQWVNTDKSQAIVLAAGIIGGFLTISVPRYVYHGSVMKSDETETREWLLSSLPIDDDNEPPARLLEPISAMLALRDEQTGTSTLHLGTVGGLGAVLSLDQTRIADSLGLPPWKKVIEDLREQFDLDRDLGGEVVARIWGLTSYRGITAVLFTRHPTDMIEYRVASGEKAAIGFISQEAGHTLRLKDVFGSQAAVRAETSPRKQREVVVSYVLSWPGEGLENDTESQKLIYAAACCAIADGLNDSIRNQARQALERLAVLTGADMSDEMANLDVPSPSISAKTNDQFAQPGAHLFEWCEICDAGIEWFSAKEAQCANGHLFSRCGLSFFTIQEPGISKYCSVCHTEYFDEELLARIRDGRLGQLFTKIFEAFDTCIYCDSKFESDI